ncbi:alanine racemase-like protein [Pontimonas salivibrio]|uniref:Alanine racemase-like protein n=1 Tax=Pontimonas salivibrio TaxID=1159327 RepID=A0A2L2BQG8_9MICO|nr:alanine racemase C-terminal domain-containing protein [Pontimonas salivibrio]AVG23901.1 alanine racemase-like protein [Pontimonas salivibrio]
MNRPADLPPLRWAITRTTPLRDSLSALLGLKGPDHHLDLRANAFGLGAQHVAQVAADLGFRFATLDAGECHPKLEVTASLPESLWLQLAHQHHAQLLQARVVNSKSVAAGAEVSYGGYYTTPTPTHLALVAIGFADGVPRLNPVGGMVEARSQRFPVAGRIAMDQLIIDTGDEALVPGDVVTVWGGAVSATEWSEWSKRPLEVMGSGIGPRVHHVVDGPLS